MSVKAFPQRVTIEGPAGPIEAVVEGSASSSDLYAVVCHPHPLYGGTMDNKVVTTLVRALQDCAIASLRFNFRGVGASAGAFDEGRGETEDARAVAAWGAARWPGRQLVLAGFSFGSYVALRLAQTSQVARLITVAPPVQRFDFSGLAAPDAPWLLVQGEADEVVDPEAVYRWVAAAGGAPNLIKMPGVGHFFHGHLAELRSTVADAIRSG